MESHWKLAIALIGLPIALGAIADNWITSKGKAALHHRMHEWYVTLSGQQMPDLPAEMARVSLRTWDRIFGRRLLAIRTVAVTVVLSIGLTAAAIAIGMNLANSRESSEWASFLGESASIRGAPALVSRMSGDHMELSPFLLILINLVLDGTTLLITRKVLRIVKRGNALVQTSAVALDVLVAFALAVSCVPLYILVLQFSRMLGGHEVSVATAFYSLDLLWLLAPGFLAMWVDTAESLLMFYLSGSVTGGATTTGLLYSSTALIPTLLYAGLLATFVMVTGCLSLGRRLTLRWFDIATEPVATVNSGTASRFKPFTILGIALGGIVAVLKAVQEIVAYFAA